MSSKSFPTLKYIIETATRFTLENGFHPATIIAVGTSNSLATAPDMPDTHEERAMMMFFAGYQIAYERSIGRLRQVTFVMEGWMSRNFDNRPSEDPDRVEILLFFHHNFDLQRHSMVGMRMIRDGKGNLIDLVTEIDTRRNASETGESPLMDAFIVGYARGREDQEDPPFLNKN